MLIGPVRPVRFASTAMTHVTMLLPRDSLRLGPAAAARLAGVRIPGDRGPGALVSALAGPIARSTTDFRADEADRTAAAVIELIAVALTALLHGEVLFARIVGPGWGVVHHRMVMALPGEQEPRPTRVFLQLLAMVWQNDRWEIATMQNSRLITLDTAAALETLPSV